ncbi:phospholipase B [Scheffersomyces xylosifermentans]|uniref:phospholipase B n=1 Tax=Scheffersomyces xylosifermentans TaxID=1304137 RepID=UPI00315DB2E8
MKSVFSALLILNYILGVQSWSPTDSYAPGPIDCPSDKKLTRTADGLSDEEVTWLEGRKTISNDNLIAFLEHANMTDFDAADFVNNKANDTIKIGIAFSGGGYRAMLCGAGQLAALDNRTTGAWEHGLGGLLQASTYLVGLSGGNWLVGTIVMNNFTDVDTILREGKIWDLSHSIVNVGGIKVWETYDYYKNIEDALDEKRDAGYDVSITDTWGRALSYQFFSKLNDTGAALTWSTLQESEPFTNYQMPFPIVVADGRTPGTTIISGNSTIFEVNPYELGSWDPSLYQFTDVKYLGTKVKDGEPENGKCIGGFDNAGFIMGTSSSLFNQFILQINTTSLSSAIKSILSSILNDISNHENDIAVYKPNPFFDTDFGTKSITNNDTLFLCDGGEDLQNVPLAPLLQPDRQVDVIFSFDNSADTDGYWPNGASLVATYQRQFLPQGNGTLFPYVPDVNSFRNLNLTAKPTFFGCDAKNLTSLLNSSVTSSKGSIYDTPLLVYTANRPFTYWSNTSTFKMSYEEKEKLGMIQNGFEVASRLNNTLDPEWAACVGCAIIRRTEERNGLEQSQQCQECFARYCWNGDLDNKYAGVNFTDAGITNGTEDNGGRSLNAGFSLTLVGEQKTSLIKLMGYALLVTAVFAISF